MKYFKQQFLLLLISQFLISCSEQPGKDSKIASSTIENTSDIYVSLELPIDSNNYEILYETYGTILNPEDYFMYSDNDYEIFKYDEKSVLFFKKINNITSNKKILLNIHEDSSYEKIYFNYEYSETNLTIPDKTLENTLFLYLSEGNSFHLYKIAYEDNYSWKLYDMDLNEEVFFGKIATLFEI